MVEPFAEVFQAKRDSAAVRRTQEYKATLIIPRE
jgi:hypothetical protein